eukprot:GHVP01053771.1.p1 GENE.GHVP01053771.1~~GHVP01053771.1.p1  ORF type:complete len:717 (+),score=142.90 GHVP01053771.1:301-2151(+)
MESIIAFEIEDVVDQIKHMFCENIICIGKPMVFDFIGSTLIVKANEVKCKVNLGEGFITPSTEIYLIPAPGSKIKLKGKGKRQQSLFIKSELKLEDLQIGGLDEEFVQIFRRAFASRTLPSDALEKLGVESVRGIMLYGPPGTGKTLIARQLGKMLNSHEPKIINGPEILSKYVGQSEENIRELFKDAEIEQSERGRDSQLHIIIFDEIDAICKRRGSRADTTGTSDTVVNQLLSKMDGVNQLSNILIIGMTNRLDLIDEALLRPGRFEISVEIGLPDEKGRLQIFKIHTTKMRENNMIEDDVDLEELASNTRNFSGAEIKGLIADASSYAMSRHVKLGTLATMEKGVNDIKLFRDDFMRALSEIKPALGVSGESIEGYVANGVIEYSPDVNRVLREGEIFCDQVRNGKFTRMASLLVCGESGSGKTAIASQIAVKSKFPFVRVISPGDIIGMSEGEKIGHIHKIFSDSYKSELSVIVVDDIERLIEFVPIGPRFSNPILQTIAVLLKKSPPKNRRLLVITTARNKILLNELGIGSSFDSDIKISNIKTHKELENVLRATLSFTEDDILSILLKLTTRSISIGIRDLLVAIETATQERENNVDPFVDLICRHSLEK